MAIISKLATASFICSLIASPAVASVPAQDDERPAKTTYSAQTISEAELGSQRGAADTQVIEQTAATTATGTVSDNTINGDFTNGAVEFAAGSLDNFSGLALFSVNTGNNVAINSSMTVNVAIQQ